MSGTLKFNRRAFLRTGAMAAGGLMVGFRLPLRAQSAAAEASTSSPGTTRTKLR